MPTEPSPWTFDTLKEYIESLLAEKNKALDAAFAATDRALTAALTASEQGLKENQQHFDQRFEERDKALILAFASSEKAMESGDEALRLHQRAQKEAVFAAFAAERAIAVEQNRAHAVELVALRESMAKEFSSERALTQERDKAIRVAQETAELARQELKEASEQRFKLLNEFRGQSEDQQGKFILKVEYKPAHDALEKEIRLNAERIARIETMDLGQRQNKEDIRKLSNDERDTSTNSREMAFAYFFGFTTFISTAAAIIFAVSKLTGH